MSKSVSVNAAPTGGGRRTQSSAPPSAAMVGSSRSPSAVSAPSLQPRSASAASGYTRAQSLASEAMMMNKPSYSRYSSNTALHGDNPLPLLGAPESAQYGSHQRHAVGSAADHNNHLLRFVQNRTAGTRFDLPTETFFTGRRVVKELHDVYARCFACVGETVWIGEKSGVLSVWDLKSGEQMGRRERQPKIFITSLLAVGLYVWVGYSDGMLRVFNPESMQLLKEVKEHVGAINQILIAFNGLTVYTASSDFTINQWDTANVERIATLSGHKNNVRCIVTAGGTRLFSASDDKSIIEWDMSSAKPRHIMKNAHSKPIRCLTAASGHLWSGSEDGTVKVWSLSSTGEMITSPNTATPTDVNAPAFNTPTATGGNPSMAATSMGRGESLGMQTNGTRSVSADRPDRADFGGFDGMSPAPKGANNAGGGATPTNGAMSTPASKVLPPTNNMMTPAAAALSAFSEPPPLVHVIGNPHTSVVTHLHTVGSKVWSACLGTLFIWDAATFALEGQFNEHDGFVTALLAVHQSSVARVWSCGSEGIVKMWNNESQWTSAFRAAQEEHLREMEALLSDAVAREERLARANQGSDDNIRTLSNENARIAARADELEAALERERMHSLELRRAIEDLEAASKARDKVDKERRDQDAIDEAKRAEEERLSRTATANNLFSVSADDALSKEMHGLLEKICKSSKHRQKGDIDDDFEAMGLYEGGKRGPKKPEFDRESYDALQKALLELSRMNSYDDGPYSLGSHKKKTDDELEAFSRWRSGDYTFGAPSVVNGSSPASDENVAIMSALATTAAELGDLSLSSLSIHPFNTGDAKANTQALAKEPESLASRLTAQNNALRMELLALRVQVSDLHRQAKLASTTREMPLEAVDSDGEPQAFLDSTLPNGAQGPSPTAAEEGYPSGATEIRISAISDDDLDTLMQIKARAVECLKKEIREREERRSKRLTAAKGASDGNNDTNGYEADDDDTKAYYDALRRATEEGAASENPNGLQVIDLCGRSTIHMAPQSNSATPTKNKKPQQSTRATSPSAKASNTKGLTRASAVGPIPVTGSLSVEDRATLALLRQKYAPMHLESTVMCGEKEAGILADIGADGASHASSHRAAVRWGSPSSVAPGGAPSAKKAPVMSLSTGALSSAHSVATSTGSAAGPLSLSNRHHNVHLVAVMPPDDVFLLAKACRQRNPSISIPFAPTAGSPLDNSSESTSRVVDVENPLPSAAVLGYLTVEELSPSEIKALERVVLEDRKRRLRKDDSDAPTSAPPPGLTPASYSVFFRPSNQGFAAAAVDGGGAPSPASRASRSSSMASNAANANNNVLSTAIAAGKRAAHEGDLDHLLHLQAVIDRTVPVGILLPPLHTLPEKELELVFMIYQRHRGTDYANLLIDQDEKAQASATEVESKRGGGAISPAEAALAGYSLVKDAQRRAKESSDSSAKAALKVLPNKIGGVRVSIDSIRADAEAALAEVLYESEVAKELLSKLQAEIDAAHNFLDSNPQIRRLVEQQGTTGARKKSGAWRKGSTASSVAPQLPQHPPFVTVSSRAPYNSRWAGSAFGGASARNVRDGSTVGWSMDIGGQSYRGSEVAGNTMMPLDFERSRSPPNADFVNVASGDPASVSKPPAASEPLSKRLQWLADAVSAQQSSISHIDTDAHHQQRALMDALRAVDRACLTGGMESRKSMPQIRPRQSTSRGPLHVSTDEDDDDFDDSIDSEEINAMVDNAQEIITGRTSAAVAQDASGVVDPEEEAARRRQVDFFNELRAVLGVSPSAGEGSIFCGSSRHDQQPSLDDSHAISMRSRTFNASSVLTDADKHKIEAAMQKALNGYRRKSARRSSNASASLDSKADAPPPSRRKSSARRGSEIIVPKTVDEEAVAHVAALATTAGILAEKHNADQQQLRQLLRQLELLKGEASEESERSAQKKALEVSELKQQLSELRDHAQKQHDQRIVNDDLRARLAALQNELDDMYRQWRRRDYASTRRGGDATEKRDRAILHNNATPKALIASQRVGVAGATESAKTPAAATRAPSNVTDDADSAKRTTSGIRTGAPTSEVDEVRESRMLELLDDAGEQLSIKQHEDALKAIQDRIAAHERIPYSFLKHFPAKGVTLNDILDRVLEDPSFVRHARDRNVFLRQRQEEERSLASKVASEEYQPTMEEKPDGGAAFKLRFKPKGAASGNTTSSSPSGPVSKSRLEEDLAKATQNLNESIQRQEDTLNDICSEIAESYRRNHLLWGFQEDENENSSISKKPPPQLAVTPEIVGIYAKKLDAVRLDNVVLRQDLAEARQQYQALQGEVAELRQRVEAEIPLHHYADASLKRTVSNQASDKISATNTTAVPSAGSAEGKLLKEQRIGHLALLQLARAELKEIRTRDHGIFINALLDLQQESTPTKGGKSVVQLPSDTNIARANVVAGGRSKRNGPALMDYPLDEAAQQVSDEIYETEVALGLRREMRLAKQVDKLQSLLEREKLRSNRTEKDLDTADKEKARADLVKKDRLEKENVALQGAVSQLERDLSVLKEQLQASKDMVSEVQHSRKKMAVEHERLREEIAKRDVDGQYHFNIPPPKTIHGGLGGSDSTQNGASSNNGNSNAVAPPTKNTASSKTQSGQTAARGKSPTYGEDIACAASNSESGDSSSIPTQQQRRDTLAPQTSGDSSQHPRGASSTADSTSYLNNRITPSPIPTMARAGSNPSSRMSTPRDVADDVGSENEEGSMVEEDFRGAASGTTATATRGRASSGKRVGFDERRVMDANSPSQARDSNPKAKSTANSAAGHEVGHSTTGEGDNQYQALPPLSPSKSQGATGSPRRDGSGSPLRRDGDRVSTIGDASRSAGSTIAENQRTPPRQTITSTAGDGGSHRSQSPMVSAREARRTEEALRERLANTESVLEQAKRELRSLRNAEEARRIQDDEEARRRIASLSGSSHLPPGADGSTSEGEEGDFDSSPLDSAAEKKNTKSRHNANSNTDGGDVPANGGGRSKANPSRGRAAQEDEDEVSIDAYGVPTFSSSSGKTNSAKPLSRHAGVNTEEPYPTRTKKASGSVRFAEVAKSPAASKLRDTNGDEDETDASAEAVAPHDSLSPRKRNTSKNTAEAEGHPTTSQDPGATTNSALSLDSNENDFESQASSSSEEGRQHPTSSSSKVTRANAVLDGISDVQAGMHTLREDALIEEIERLNEHLEDLQAESDQRKQAVDDLVEELEELRVIRDKLVERTVQLEQDIESSRNREDMLVDALDSASRQQQQQQQQQQGGESVSRNLSATAGHAASTDPMSSPEAKSYVAKARQQAEELEVRNAELQMKLREKDRELNHIKAVLNNAAYPTPSSSKAPSPSQSHSRVALPALDSVTIEGDIAAGNRNSDEALDASSSAGTAVGAKKPIRRVLDLDEGAVVTSTRADGNDGDDEADESSGEATPTTRGGLPPKATSLLSTSSTSPTRSSKKNRHDTQAESSGVNNAGKRGGGDEAPSSSTPSEYRRYDDDYDHSIVDRYKEKNATLARQLAEALETAKLATDMFEAERARNSGQQVPVPKQSVSKRPPRRDVDAERFNALVNQLEDEILSASVASGINPEALTGSGSAFGGKVGAGGVPSSGPNTPTRLPNASALQAQQLLGDTKEVEAAVHMRRRDLQLGLGMALRNPSASNEKVNESFEEMVRFFNDRERRWKQFANQQNLTANAHLKMLTESSELASKLRTLSYLFETRPILIRALYEIYKLLAKTLKINHYHRKIVGNRPLTRIEALDQNTELSDEVEITKEGARWVIANLFTSFELCHIGASPSMFIPDGRRPTWRDIVIPEKYQRIILQASQAEEEAENGGSRAGSQQSAAGHRGQSPVPVASQQTPPAPQLRFSVQTSARSSSEPAATGNGPHHVGVNTATLSSTPTRAGTSVPVAALGYPSPSPNRVGGGAPLTGRPRY